MNFDLNPGGIIGALAGLAVGCGILFATWPEDGESQGRKGKLVIFTVVVGATAGNKLWSIVFRKPKAVAQDAQPERIAA